MKKKFSIVSLIILILCLIGILQFSISFFNTGKIHLFTLLKLLLCLLGITSFILHLKQKGIYIKLNILWILPQLFTVTKKIYTSKNMVFPEPIYDLTVAFKTTFGLIRGIDDVTFISYEINIIQVVLLIFCIIALKKQRHRTTQSSGPDSTAS